MERPILKRLNETRTLSIEGGTYLVEDLGSNIKNAVATFDTLQMDFAEAKHQFETINVALQVTKNMIDRLLKEHLDQLKEATKTEVEDKSNE